LQKIKLYQQLFTRSASFVHVRCEKPTASLVFRLVSPAKNEMLRRALLDAEQTSVSCRVGAAVSTLPFGRWMPACRRKVARRPGTAATRSPDARGSACLLTAAVPVPFPPPSRDAVRTASTQPSRAQRHTGGRFGSVCRARLSSSARSAASQRTGGLACSFFPSRTHGRGDPLTPLQQGAAFATNSAQVDANTVPE